MILGLVITALLLVPPFWMMLPRYGLPAPLALVAAIPIGAVILLWVVALRRDPGDDIPGRFK